MSARTLTLLIFFAGLLAVVGCDVPTTPISEETTESERPVAPPPHEAKPSLKPWSELIVGTWKRDNKRSDGGRVDQEWLEFTVDGKRIRRTEWKEEVQSSEGRYKLDGTAISFQRSPNKPPPPPPPVDSIADIVEMSFVIDFPTEDQLVMHTTITSRLSPQMIKDTINGREEERAALTAYRRVEREKTVYDRVKR